MDRWEPLLDIYGHVKMELHGAGKYVLYTDHLAAITEKDKEIERLEGEIAEKDEKIKLLIKDAVIMALRLYGEDRATFGPECYEVMERWTELVELRLKVNNNYKTTK